MAPVEEDGADAALARRKGAHGFDEVVDPPVVVPHDQTPREGCVAGYCGPVDFTKGRG